jgi:uncharacterized protein YodC (DUF2158 family)
MAIEIGSVVQLKGGGPIMTVTAEGKDGEGKKRLTCTWFDKDGHEKTGGYPEAALEIYEGEPGPIIA